MRRTDFEFREEVLRRAEAYRQLRKKRAKIVAAICLPVILCSGGLLALFSSGFGGSATSVSFDSAKSAEYVEAPAAAAPESVMEEHDSLADSPVLEPAEGMEERVLSITVTTHSEATEYVRLFTSEQQTAAILDAIDDFLNAPETVIGGDEVGDSEGMAYVIAVITETGDREYVLFNDALLIDGAWYVNAGCYQTLEELVLQEDD